MLIFDAHLDLAMNALEWNRDLRWSHERIRRHELGMKDKVDRGNHTVCFPEMRRGGIGLCVATQIARHSPRFHTLPGWASPEQAWAQTQGQLAWYRVMEECGELVQIRDRGGLEAAVNAWVDYLETRDRAGAPPVNAPPIGYILSLEGADSLVRLEHLEESYSQGLRALGPAHYGPGIYAHGTDAEGPLPARGRELLKEMDRLGIILDATHLCDQSFDEALDLFCGPVWASHQNCRTLAPWNRQFDDRQIRRVIERGGILGMAFDAIMMVPGWKHLRSTPKEFNLKISRIRDHIDHVCQIAGDARHVGIGSDLDGGYGTEQTPMDLDSIADLQTLPELLRESGYTEENIADILHGNVIRFLMEAWKE